MQYECGLADSLPWCNQFDTYFT